jgi:hypothetical protein
MRANRHARLQAIREQIWELEERHNDLAEKLFPPGCDATYQHGPNAIAVTIVRHANGRALVRGVGRSEYWVGAERLI